MTISEHADTTAVCSRNPLYYNIFPAPENSGTTTDISYADRFPVLFTEINRTRESEAAEILLRQLKDGKEIPAKLFQGDWIILVVIISAVLYASLSAFYGRLFQEAKRFFLFGGIGDPASRDIMSIFNWKSTLINLISFFNIALFIYCTASFYDIIPDKIPGYIFWLISFLITSTTVTLRHIVCYLTGKISVAHEAFDEYLVTVYLSYRFMALVLYILVILLLYTSVLPLKLLLFSGFILSGFLYLMRIFRLLLIFLKHNISILYLILYLCALEFLPVLIVLKYLTALS